MSAKRQAAKRDANEPEIIAALKGAGCSVQDLSGGGIPDLLVGFADIETGELKNVLIEVKNPDTYGKLNELQVKWHAAWKGQVAVIETADEALQLVGRMDRPQADESEGHDITLIEPITVAVIEPEVVSVDVATTEPAAQPDIKLLPAHIPHPYKDAKSVFVTGHGQQVYKVKATGWLSGKPTVTVAIGKGIRTKSFNVETKEWKGKNDDILWTVFADRVSIDNPFMRKTETEGKAA